jgi:hypothetical protein
MIYSLTQFTLQSRYRDEMLYMLYSILYANKAITANIAYIICNFL